MLITFRFYISLKTHALHSSSGSTITCVKKSVVLYVEANQDNHMLLENPSMMVVMLYSIYIIYSMILVYILAKPYVYNRVASYAQIHIMRLPRRV